MRALEQNVTLKIILDANFLLIPLQFKIDIFESLSSLLNRKFQPVILSTTHGELRKMAEKNGSKLGKQAATALKTAENCTLFNVEKNPEETNDDVILRVATQWKSPVATNDRELRRKLRKQGIPVIFLRGKNRLELEGAL